jgi:hypothetical protein
MCLDVANHVCPLINERGAACGTASGPLLHGICYEIPAVFLQFRDAPIITEMYIFARNTAAGVKFFGNRNRLPHGRSA